MKKTVLSVLTLVLILTSSACAFTESITPYSVTKDAVIFTVDPGTGTISDGEASYQYTITETSSGYDVRIKYPNGASYWWNAQDTGLGVGGHDEAYDEGRYPSGAVLLDVLEGELPSRELPKSIPLILILLCIGIFDVLWPRALWHLTVRWQCKNGEPSRLALGLIRFTGAAAVIAAVVLIFA